MKNTKKTTAKRLVIVRHNLAGVIAGEVVKQDDKSITLTNAYRLWRWWAKDGVSLSAVSRNGVKYCEALKISKYFGKVQISCNENMAEVMDISQDALTSIKGAAKC